VKGLTGKVVVGCVVAAAVALAALSLAGNVRAGAAVALGLLLGSVNGALAERALGAGVSLRMSSLPRLGVLSALAVVCGLLIGVAYTWIVVLGVAGAQLVLVFVAARSLYSR
jgi:hypothetical protein